MNINIQDSLQQLKEAVEELEALRTVIAMAEDHPVYSCDRETLIVTRTALEPIPGGCDPRVFSILRPNRGVHDSV